MSIRKFIWVIPIFLFLFFLFFLFHKTEEDKVITIIKNKKNTIVGINYPRTKYGKLNKEIKNYVDNIYNDFKDYDSFLHINGKAELNIDYAYFLADKKYMSITLYSYIDSSLLTTPLKEVKTFVYDIQKNKFINIIDLVKDKEELKEKIKEELLIKYGNRSYNELLTTSYLKEVSFCLSEDRVTIYLPNYENINAPLLIHIPYSYFKIKTEEKEKEVFYYHTKIKTIDTEKKVIALTFDDGPSRYTKEILKVLRKHKINATFFVLGNKVSLYEDTLKEMIKDGNEIGNHSYNHKLMSNLNENEIKEQIQKTQEILTNKLGYTPVSFRPTYGSINKKVKQSTSMHITLWTIDTLDWKIKDPNRIATRAMKAKDMDIILMHDSKGRTIKALDILIPKLLDKGYQFVTINELEEVKQIRKKIK